MSHRFNELCAWDRDHLLHPGTHIGAHARGELPTRVISGGKGVYITDKSGRTSLDAFAGLFCVNVGYGRQKIAEAIAKQANELPYYHAYDGHGTEAPITLSRMIIDRAPKGMSRVFFGLSGSDANETNIKLIWYYNNALGRPEKKKIISRWRAYHGSTVMTGSLTGLELYHNAFDLPRTPILHTEAPYYFRRADATMSEEQFVQACVDKLEAMIVAEGPDTVAAFIGEPIQGAGGIIPPPTGYWAKVQSVLKKYDILLIADEVVSGFGRLGRMFGSDHYDIRPDLITISKGLTSAYAPLSGVIISDKVWQVFVKGSDQLGSIGHGWTCSAHPICAAAAIANLELIDEMDLITNARDIGAYLQSALTEALGDHGNVGEVRGDGLMAAVEFVEDRDNRILFDTSKKVGEQVAAALLERGVIGRALPQGDILGFAPPLCLTKHEADIIVESTVDAVNAVFATF
ncbi:MULTISPECIES: aspartate aminotransferase family protein [unclassified Bradyrhizobium]|uniref:aspartate aminotransferase family protein n=1 Tax=unclassified Bradyrhizobium TaxID=2631580 RepID=UPI001FF935A5|nr:MULTISPECIES: aspartate aminotransferase family protein [unclassified Bradyrhizobium]MCK1668867.1 aspartate aminotransferase family protein [Bradyrhizobium sp. 153]MCK1755791.1 aspartate aminotransferase family protein [Bradyrhizobium sp. 137]